MGLNNSLYNESTLVHHGQSRQRLFHLLNRLRHGLSFPGMLMVDYLQKGQILSMSHIILKALPGKLGIKRREPGILFISLQIGSLFILVRL